MHTKLSSLTLLLAVNFSTALADEPAPLINTKPLTLQGDLAAQMVQGIDKFLLRKTEESVSARSSLMKLDFSSPENYAASLEPNRKRLTQILGLRDPRVPFDAPSLVANTAEPALVGKSPSFEAFTVRWPAFGNAHGEGLLLVPINRKPIADVVAIPDADQTPEQIAGLAPGLPDSAQSARRLAESGCRVIVPTLIDRALELRGGRAKLTSREYIYRPAFILGRTLIGYELQKIFAAVDWFVKDANGADPKIGVLGWGEGGLLSLYAGAIDTRIDVVSVSGYFGPRESLWQEPIDRNLFGLLEQFGDAEIAALIAPRTLLIEASNTPEVLITPGNAGAPGRITSPTLKAVSAEWNRAQALVKPIESLLPLITPPSGLTDIELTLPPFLQALAPASHPAPLGPFPTHLRPASDPARRQARQLAELDRHNQQLLLESPYVRAEFMKKIDTSSLEAFKTSVEPYRKIFADDVIGRFNDPLLPFNLRSRKILDEPKYHGYEVLLDVFPDVFAYGILLIPKGLNDAEKRPVVVCQHGLEGRPQDLADPSINSPYYNQFAIRLAERGFITFSPQNPYIGHDAFRTLQRKANPLKKTLFSIIIPQHQQITNWLKTIPFVDGSRIAFYGLSYGGKSAMRIPPLVSNYTLSICSADFNEWVEKNASTRSPYSYVWTPEYEIFEWNLGATFNYAEMAALIAPRPFMVERGHFDGVGSDEAVAHEFAKVRFLYEAKLGIGDRCELEFFTGPHTIHGVGTFDFLRKHLHFPKP